MDDLIAFVRARLDEDEMAAANAGGEVWDFTGPNCEVRVREPDGDLGRIIAYCRHGNPLPDDLALAIHIGHNDPARMRREVWAKRKIIEVYEAAAASDDPAIDYSIGMATMRMVLRSYATVWSDHPDYRQEWTP